MDDDDDPRGGEAGAPRSLFEDSFSIEFRELGPLSMLRLSVPSLSSSALAHRSWLDVPGGGSASTRLPAAPTDLRRDVLRDLLRERELECSEPSNEGTCRSPRPSRGLGAAGWILIVVVVASILACARARARDHCAHSLVTRLGEVLGDPLV